MTVYCPSPSMHYLIWLKANARDKCVVKTSHVPGFHCTVTAKQLLHPNLHSSDWDKIGRNTAILSLLDHHTFAITHQQKSKIQ